MGVSKWSSKGRPLALDLWSLKRGSVIPDTIITKAYGHDPGTPEYQFDRMALAKIIKDHFEEERDDTVSVAYKGDGLQILDHKEQDSYVARKKRQYIRGWMNRHREDMGTDATQLDEDARKRRERRLVTHSWLQQQMYRRKPPELKE